MWVPEMSQGYAPWVARPYYVGGARKLWAGWGGVGASHQYVFSWGALFIQRGFSIGGPFLGRNQAAAGFKIPWRYRPFT